MGRSLLFSDFEEKLLTDDTDEHRRHRGTIAEAHVTHAGITRNYGVLFLW